MKLITFTEQNLTRIGIIKEEMVIDLSMAVPELPRNMRAFLEAGSDAMEKARVAERSSIAHFPLTDVSLNAPVPNPGKVLGIGLNYRDHVEETGQVIPEHQIWFNKQHNCIAGPYDNFMMPTVSDKLDYEGELCMVIGKHCKHVPKERAHEVIAGYFCGNDGSVRDWQGRSPSIQIGKSFDTHGPIGPWIVTPDEVGDPHDLTLKTWVNGELRQNSNTKNLIFDCYEQIAHLTQAFPLDPGDILFTGTPSGVAKGFEPPKFLKIGDVVRVEIEKLGYIENRVTKEEARTLIE
ncbi:MAG: fumarylacetoacetate hydrolase family protein [SAR324 cluster bacterium]|nr:fumarylacetoacetate hydrolase family protein [SAR324 cluster bacterium]